MAGVIVRVANVYCWEGNARTVILSIQGVARHVSRLSGNHQEVDVYIEGNGNSMIYTVPSNNLQWIRASFDASKFHSKRNQVVWIHRCHCRYLWALQVTEEFFHQLDGRYDCMKISFHLPIFHTKYTIGQINDALYQTTQQTLSIMLTSPRTQTSTVVFEYFAQCPCDYLQLWNDCISA